MKDQRDTQPVTRGELRAVLEAMHEWHARRGTPDALPLAAALAALPAREEAACAGARQELAERVNRACAEIGREVGYRRSCYPKWVSQGRMKQETADRQIRDLEDAATLLRELSGVGR